MKHLVLSVLTLTTIILSSCDDRPVPPAQLPAPIKAFAQQYFPNQTILFAQKDIVFFGSEYEIHLADGTQVNFDRSNEWDKVNCQMAAVPTALIPAPIATYCTTNFPGVIITKIDKEHYGYEIELANDMELKFTEQGALISMDD